jgi:hypothetical protein
MAEQDSGGTFRQTKAGRITRRVVEFVTAAALLGAALYFPTTNTGRVYLGALAVVFFICLLLLRKWPSG